MSKIDLIIDALECASPKIKGVMYPAGYHMKLAQALAAARELREELAKPPVELTDEDIGDVYVAWDNTDGASFADFARLIETKSRSKNNG